MLFLIHIQMKSIKTSAPEASAVSVASGLGYLAYAQQYALSAYDCAIDLSLDNVDVHVFMRNGYTAVGYTLKRWGERIAPAPGSGRDGWRQEALHETYSSTLLPILETASRVAAIPIRELWGQLSTGLRYYMRVWSERASSDCWRHALEENYRYLREELDPSAFGMKINPYRRDPILTEDAREPGKMIPLKSACCLYYKWEDGDYCFSCPRLKESERERRRIAWREANAAN
jgi:ferric iron reductase protein FhuF